MLRGVLHPNTPEEFLQDKTFVIECCKYGKNYTWMRPFMVDPDVVMACMEYQSLDFLDIPKSLQRQVPFVVRLIERKLLHWTNPSISMGIRYNIEVMFAALHILPRYFAVWLSGVLVM